MQVLNNLISNAIKFTFSGSVHVTARLDRSSSGPGNVLISVKDTGLGIDASKLQTIFLPFEQVRQRRCWGDESIASLERQLRIVLEYKEAIAERSSHVWHILAFRSLPIL